MNEENSNENPQEKNLEENLNLNENKTDNLNTEEQNNEAPVSEAENNEEDSRSRFQEFFNEDIQSSGPKMTETLLALHQLRSIDEELTEIEDEKGDLPDKIESIKSDIKTLEKELGEKKQSLSKLEDEKTKLTADNTSYEEKINKYDEQKYDVRSNKEYDEIVKTIDGLFEEVKTNESRLNDINEIYSMLETDIEELEKKTNELNSELTEKQTLLDELDEQYKQDESGLKEKRNELLTKLDSSSRTLYERINSSYKGEATAIVRKGNCSGCYNSIPPQRVIEIKSAEKIYTCQSCGRILIAEELLSQQN